MPSATVTLSPRLCARIAGLLSLVAILAGAYDIGYVRSILMVPGDAAATLQHIVSHPALVRSGLAAHLLLLMCNIAVEILLFTLFSRVNRILAGIALAGGLVGTAIEAVGLVHAVLPLVLAQETRAVSAFNPEQLQAWSYVAMQLEESGLLISFVFFGLDEILTGLLMMRSGFVPVPVGALLGLAGLCYLAQGYASFAAPELAAAWFPYILFPCLPGEGLSALWLAVVGVDGGGGLPRAPLSGAPNS